MSNVTTQAPLILSWLAESDAAMQQLGEGPLAQLKRCSKATGHCLLSTIPSSVTELGKAVAEALCIPTDGSLQYMVCTNKTDGGIFLSLACFDEQGESVGQALCNLGNTEQGTMIGRSAQGLIFRLTRDMQLSLVNL